jgi:hypothetical protein
MKNFPQKITSENFGEAAKSILSASASIKNNEKAKKIIRPIGSILFVFFSFLFIYGAIYKSSSAEEMVVFEKLAPITKIWNFFAGILTKPDMKWYIFAGILVVAAFVIPLLVSAIIKLVVSLTHKADSNQFSDGGTAANAKKLHLLATDLYKNSSNYEDSSVKTPYKVIFVLLIAALLVYAFIVLKMIATVALFGFAIALLLLYWVYGFIFSAFFALNKLFYKKPYISNITKATEEYWLSVDVEEVNRRKAEEKRKEEQKKKQEEKRKQKEAKQQYKTSQQTTEPTRAIDKYDSFTWTNEYVRNNENECSDIALSILKVSKELLEEGDYSGAAAGFDKVVYALELLKNIDSEYYLPPLFANCYALCKIFAFGLNNKDSACKYAKKACEYASKCNSATARKDLAVMTDFYNALMSANSISSLLDEFDIDFPYDILRMG